MTEVAMVKILEMGKRWGGKVIDRARGFATRQAGARIGWWSGTNVALRRR
jgi:hypothetical protein